MLFSKKSHGKQIEEKNCVQNLEIIQNAFVMNVEKSIKHIAKISFSVFGGNHIFASFHYVIFY